MTSGGYLSGDLHEQPGTLSPYDAGQRGSGGSARIGSGLATATIAAGLAVCGQGGDLSLPATELDVTMGLRGIAVRPYDAPTIAPWHYVQHEPAQYVRGGRVWVRVESAVQADAPVFVRFAEGRGGSQLGAIRGDSDAGTAAPIRRASFYNFAQRCALIRIDL